MRNLWLVAKREFRNTVVRRGFLLGTLAAPVGIAVLLGLVILVETLSENRLPLGYVDHAGVLDVTRQTSMPDADDRLEIRAFPDEETALAALKQEEIQAFFVLQPDYPQTLRTDLYYLQEPPSDDAWGAFDDFVRYSLIATLPDDAQKRLFEGPHIVVRDIVSQREFSEQGVINVILPFVASVFFFITTMSVSTYMLDVVAAEKENRTMEILVTSVTPGQLIGGKTAGLLAAALIQLFIYAIAVVVGLKVAAPFVKELQEVSVPWTYLGVMAVFFLPAYGLIAGLMVAVGAIATELQQGQQVAGILSMLFMLPLFLLGLLFSNPGHPGIVLLTLFPTSAFLTISLRWGLGTIPLWQLEISWVLLVATTLFVVWVAARMFRAGMLHYGQPLSLKAVLAAMRSA